MGPLALLGSVGWVDDRSARSLWEEGLRGSWRSPLDTGHQCYLYPLAGRGCFGGPQGVVLVFHREEEHSEDSSLCKKGWEGREVIGGVGRTRWTLVTGHSGRTRDDQSDESPRSSGKDRHGGHQGHQGDPWWTLVIPSNPIILPPRPPLSVSITHSSLLLSLSSISLTDKNSTLSSMYYLFKFLFYL